MENMIEIKELEKEYKKFKLDIKKLEIKKGSITGLIGKNGAGKTTLLNCLMNILDCKYEYYLFNQKKVSYNDFKFRSEIGYVGDSFDAYQNTKISAITAFYKSVYGKKWNKNKYDSLINLFELDTTKKVSELSKGMKIKYQFSLVLARETEFLLLDEPTSGLDPIIREEMLEILKKENQLHNTTILFSSHITEDIERIASDLIFVDDGICLLEGKLSNIKDRFKSIDNIPEDMVNNPYIVKQGDYFIVDTENIGNEGLKLDLSKNCDLSQILIYLRGERHEKFND